MLSRTSHSGKKITSWSHRRQWQIPLGVFMRGLFSWNWARRRSLFRDLSLLVAYDADKSIFTEIKVGNCAVDESILGYRTKLLKRSLFVPHALKTSSLTPSSFQQSIRKTEIRCLEVTALAPAYIEVVVAGGWTRMQMYITLPHERRDHLRGFTSIFQEPRLLN